MIAFTISSAILLMASPAAAPSGTAGTEGAQPRSEATSSETDAASERRICRRIEANTGSRLVNARRVCMTAREWRAHERAN